MRARLLGAIERWRSDRAWRAAAWLVAGRAVGCVATVAIPIVLVRVFAPDAFGTYKQLLLISATLFGLAQLGAAECLYYFIPRDTRDAGRSIANAVALLAAAGAASAIVLLALRGPIGEWFNNPNVADTLPLVAIYLALTLVAAPFEIVMVCRHEHVRAAVTYALSDVARAALFVVPAYVFGDVRTVLMGAVFFAAARALAMFVYLSKTLGRDLRLDRALFGRQMVYALPFALAVGIDVVQANIHQWIVAARFDAVTFAIYSVGCLQIPLVDLIATSTANVMMVNMAAAETRNAQLLLWHETTLRLAAILLPLTALLFAVAGGLIQSLFTSTYLPSVPIFMTWCLMIVPSVFAVDAVLRAHAQTRFLLVMNIVRLALIAGLVGVFISGMGLIGAVLVTIAATVIVKCAALVRVARLMDVGLARVLPWRRLASVAVRAGAAAVPAWLVTRALIAPLPSLLLGTVLYGAVYLALTLGLPGARVPTPRPWLAVSKPEA